MSEFAAFLADNELEHIEETLSEAGITRVDELSSLDADALDVLGLDAATIARLHAALGIATPPPRPKFQWQRSAGLLVAEAIAEAGALPPPPRPPLQRKISSFSALNMDGAPAAPPKLVWRRSAEGVWDEHEHDDAAPDAAPLADGWEAVKTSEGQTYYHHVQSGQTTWVMPSAATALPPAPAAPSAPAVPALSSKATGSRHVAAKSVTHTSLQSTVPWRSDGT